MRHRHAPGRWSDEKRIKIILKKKDNNNKKMRYSGHGKSSTTVDVR